MEKQFSEENSDKKNCYEYWNCEHKYCPVYLRKKGRVCFTLDSDYCLENFMLQKNPEVIECSECDFFRKMEFDFYHKWNKLKKELYRLQEKEEIAAQETEYKKNIFKERTAALSQPLSPKEDSEISSVVIFYLNDEQYGIDVNFVSETYLLKDISLVPCTPEYFAGVTNYRGEILTIIELSKFLGINSKNHGGKQGKKNILIVVNQGVKTGLLVNKVCGLAEFSLKEISPPLSALSDEARKYVKGEVRKDKIVTIILDIEKIMDDNRLFVEYVRE